MRVFPTSKLFLFLLISGFSLFLAGFVIDAPPLTFLSLFVIFAQFSSLFISLHCLKKVAFHISLPKGTERGSSVLGVLTLRSSSSIPFVKVRVHLPFSNEVPEEEVPGIFPEEPLSITFTASADVRGVFSEGVVELECFEPLGFWKLRKSDRVKANFTVLPPEREFPFVPPPSLTFRRETLVVQNKRGRGAEFLGVRPYVPGDSAKDIHWKSVAKTGKLMVKERSASADVEVLLFLDPVCSDPEAVAECGRYAVEECRRQGIPVRLVTPDGTVEEYSKILLYLASFREGEDSFHVVRKRVSEEARGATLLVLTTRDPAYFKQSPKVKAVRVI